MADIKLAKLRDRTPVKVTISIAPDLAHSLNEYAEAYRQSYGEAEPVHELIPAMLASFLDSDRGFARRRRRDGQ